MKKFIYKIIIAIIILILIYLASITDDKKSEISEKLQWNILKIGFENIEKQIENITIYLQNRY